MKSLGATAVFDYHDVDVVDKIKAATGNSIQYGLDAIGLPETQELSQKVFGPAGGKLITLLWANKTRVREDVALSCRHREGVDIFGTQLISRTLRSYPCMHRARADL